MINRESDFKELTEIGRGAFSSVYSCRHTLDDKAYALKKVTLRAPKGKPESLSAYVKVLEEVKHLSSMTHPNVVRYYSCWVSSEAEKNTVEPSTQPNSGKKPKKADGETHFDLQKSPQKVKQRSNDDGQEYDQLKDNRLEQKSPFFAANESVQSIHFSSCSNISDGRDAVSSPEGETKQPQKGADIIRLSELIDNSTLPSAKPGKMEFYIQTELCQTTLKEYLEERNRRIKVSPEDKSWIKEAFVIAKQLISGLIYLSSEHIIHRDIKPANIFIKEGLQVKYGDFGLVKICTDYSDNSFPPTPVLSPAPSEVRKGSVNCDERNAEHFEVPTRRERRYSCWEDDVNYDLTTKIGTTMYASPEQMGKTKYTKKSDYYSLGLVLLEVFMPLHTEMERYKVFLNIRKNGLIGKELLGRKRLTELLEGLLRLDSSQRSALDCLLWDITAEETNFMKKCEGGAVGPVEFSREGSREWSLQYLLFASERILFYDSLANEKAHLQITPDAFRVNLVLPEGKCSLHDCDKDTQTNIEFWNPTVAGFTIRAPATLAAQLLARFETFY